MITHISGLGPDEHIQRKASGGYWLVNRKGFHWITVAAVDDLRRRNPYLKIKDAQGGE